MHSQTPWADPFQDDEWESLGLGPLALQRLLHEADAILRLPPTFVVEPGRAP